MRRLPWITCVLALAALAPAAAGGDDAVSLAEFSRPSGRAGRIVNGVFEKDQPAVGALLIGANPNTAGTWCSGTLIGCETFLTAGHCVDGFGPGNFTVFVPSAGFFSVASIDLHPTYSFPVTDVAVLGLGAPVDGVAPVPINTTVDPPSNSAGTIVGFGRSGGANDDYGLKRSGAVVTATCPSSSFYSGSVCWRFQNPLGPAGSNANTCNADSGGPLLIDFGGGPRVAGVTSGGTNATCNPTDTSYDLNVFQQASFIQSAGGADLANTSCGTLPQVGEALTEVAAFSGTVSSAAPESFHSFEVPAGTVTLRVAMTGVDDGSDFDLYVRAGSPPTTLVFDCKDDGSNQYNFCEFTAPATGTWHVLARRFAGQGPYQVTVTTFGRDCSLPANDGLVCDDGNDCTESDVCAAAACSGTPVLDGSACDDGDDCTAPDSCQAGACGGIALADGTPCDDGDACSQPDVCQSGSCSGAAPAAACKEPITSGRAFLQLKDRTPNSGDRLAWRWVRGEATAKAEFGNPTAATDYHLCVYDEVAGTPLRVVRQRIPAGAAWTEFSRGYRYRDTSLTQGGIFSVLLREGGDGAAKIIVKGKAHPLEMPALGLQQDSTVTAQLVNGTGCWRAEYGSNLRNDSTQFRARAD